jgi:hypothetical protein
MSIPAIPTIQDLEQLPCTCGGGELCDKCTWLTALWCFDNGVPVIKGGARYVDPTKVDAADLPDDGLPVVDISPRH